MLAFFTASVYAQEIIIPERWQIKPVRPIFQEDTLTIRIFGDLMMHEAQIKDAARPDGTYEFSTYFTHIQKYLDNSDLNIGNLEFTLGGKPYTGYPAFSAPDEYARHITDCGFNVFLTANNHICDKYSAGMTRTLRIYRELAQSDSIVFTGTAGNQKEFEETTPLIIIRKGIRIAIINATYGTNIGSEKSWPKTNYLRDKKMLKDALIKAEENADIVVVFPHWGDEYILTHNSRQESEAKWFAENGADLIIGTHPHVIQDADTLVCDGKDVPVVYSLGNSVSNMSAANTQAGLMVTARIVRKSNGDIQVLSPEYKYTWCSRPGGYGNSYYVIPITDFLDRKNEWKGQWDYDKMLTTYRRVREITGIKEKTDK
jgi:poly-gamma-glutamate synthesis protein (capsule biosynthesis protein)